MRSKRGFFAAVALLLAVPLTFLYNIVFGDDNEVVVHLALATGSFLIAWAMFDFGVRRWMTWIASGTTAVLATIFLLQGLSGVIPNESLRYLAYDVLGQGLELILIYPLLAWLATLLLTDSQGRTRTLGFVIMLAIVAFELYRFVLLQFGAFPGDAFKLLYLLPFVWFLLEARKHVALGVTR
jgi:hypothetical protein